MQIVGNLGQDPEAFEFEGGGQKSTFRVATNYSYKDRSGNKKTETDWHTVVAFGQQAEFANNYLRTGDRVQVWGRMTYRSYTDNQGVERWVAELKAESVTSLKKFTQEPQQESEQHPEVIQPEIIPPEQLSWPTATQSDPF